MNKDFEAYNNALANPDKEICDLLYKEIDENLRGAESKIWHGAPVWFWEGNPIVGYTKRKVGVTLLFWSGQSFDESGLEKEGTFKAAQKKYLNVEEIDTKDLARWLKKAKDIQWDYKNIVKRKGKLVRLK